MLSLSHWLRTRSVLSRGCRNAWKHSITGRPTPNLAASCVATCDSGHASVQHPHWRFMLQNLKSMPPAQKLYASLSCLFWSCWIEYHRAVSSVTLRGWITTDQTRYSGVGRLFYFLSHWAVAQRTSAADQSNLQGAVLHCVPLSRDINSHCVWNHRMDSSLITNA